MQDEERQPVAYVSDKVPEEKMAELIGTTKRALEGKRSRGVIPEGVWKKIDGRIFYSIRRYEAWLEGSWGYPLESSSSASQSGSVLLGTVSVDPKRSHIPKPSRGSRRQPIYALK
ncbi:hypothetical protein QVM48_22235 [Pseudomonas soli]|jgi:hypothetical protein|uniref:Uncharacterized protein n=1 Tax=Pseudomonas soli TaxID=1306993 RepID=A0A1H9PYR1_9PSED|nr:hypothetical protein [Pseudomonas soli]MDT3716277.1 hypothetical protein [Pseudomonas soli]MDT3732027.1 hypothetical protein [Pseudomonas soli]SER52975.1 hypothetical protein SAMN05216230_10937 [Pseudomonas soli]